MGSLNKAMLIGNIVRDPELKYTPQGIAYARISLATSESWKDKHTGERREKTEWHRIIAWGRLAEICGEYLRKGAQVYFEGRIETKKWEKDGIDRWSTEIIADKMTMLGGKKSDQRQQPRPAETKKDDEDYPGDDPAKIKPVEDYEDIPF